MQLLTATQEGKELRYAREVPLGDDPELKKDQLSCEVQSEGLEDQLLKAPRFLGLVFPRKPRPVRLPPTEDEEPDTSK